MTKICAVSPCKEAQKKSRYCLAHYKEIAHTGGITGVNGRLYKKRLHFSLCSVEGCVKDERHNGLCSSHYKRDWRHGDTEVCPTVKAYTGQQCKDEHCTSVAEDRGLCKRHAKRVRAFGRLHRIIPKKDEGKATPGGYISIMNELGELEYEHRAIARRALGKPLPPGAVVHHVNGIKTDNRPENLIILPGQSYHMQLHMRQLELGVAEAQLGSWEDLLNKA